MECVLLAAGFGSRMEPLSSYIPKPLLPIGSKTALGYSLDLAKDLSLELIVVTGHKGKKIESYLELEYPQVEIIKNPKRTTNLFDSLALAEPFVSDNFVWASPVFFESTGSLKEVINSHEDSFMSLIAQTQTAYKLKLNFSNNSLSEFVVGEVDYKYSSPTFFVSNKKIFQYIKKFSEKEIIQKAIDSGEKFNVKYIDSWSRAIHYPEDYFNIHKSILGKKYISGDSKLQSCAVGENVFAYNCNLEDCKLSNCILIDMKAKNLAVEDCILFGENNDKLSFSN